MPPINALSIPRIALSVNVRLRVNAVPKVLAKTLELEEAVS